MPDQKHAKHVKHYELLCQNASCPGGEWIRIEEGAPEVFQPWWDDTPEEDLQTYITGHLGIDEQSCAGPLSITLIRREV